MTKESIGFRDVYELVDSRTAEIMNKFDGLENRVGRLEGWKAELTGKLSVIVALIVFAVTFATDWVKKQLKIT